MQISHRHKLKFKCFFQCIVTRESPVPHLRFAYPTKPPTAQKVPIPHQKTTLPTLVPHLILIHNQRAFCITGTPKPHTLSQLMSQASYIVMDSHGIIYLSFEISISEAQMQSICELKLCLSNLFRKVEKTAAELGAKRKISTASSPQEGDLSERSLKNCKISRPTLGRHVF